VPTKTTAKPSHLAYDAERKRALRGQGSDIGTIPPAEDPARRAKAEADFEFFAVTYFPNGTGLWPFSPDHKRGNRRLQDAADNGGRSLEALPRGSGKSTRGEVYTIWCTATGRRNYVSFFGADRTKAADSIDSIKMELGENDLLYADFPEICHAFRALENKPQRCASQTHNGKLTHIDWTADTIVFPSIEGSKASGAIISCHGLLSASRGLKHKRPDGTTARPDLVVLDDIQTDDSAKSAAQIAKRLKIIRKSILKLSGHGKTLTVVCNGTVIEKGDVMDQLLADPSWQGVRVKAIRSWSKHHDDMWMGEYKRIRQTYDKELDGDQLRAKREATEYYRANRAAMDEGCEVYWEHCYDRDQELSAIQHFYNALIDDGAEVFASEFQQEPLEDERTANALKPADLADRALEGVERWVVPSGCSVVTGFIDVQGKALYWGVVGWRERFGGHVAAYGVYPEQPSSYHTLREIPVSLQSVVGTEDQAAAIYAGLEVVVPMLLEREYQSETSDGSLSMSLLTIDANWRQYEGVVRDFCRRSRFGTRLMPSHGRHVGAAHKGMTEGKAKLGERSGPGWLTDTKDKVRHLAHDANFWKSMLATRLRMHKGDPLAITFHAGTHTMFIDHITSEYPQIITNETTGKRVEQWELIPGRDNHWLDCCSGAMVAASYSGINAVGAETKPAAKKVVYTSEMLAQKRAELRARFG
jgi:hypothetical protein